MQKLKMNKNRIVIILISVVFLLLTITFVFSMRFKKPVLQISYTEFLGKVHNNQIKSVSISDSAQLKGEFKDGEQFITDNPRIDGFKESMLVKNIEVKESSDQYSPGQLALAIGAIGAFAGVAIYLSKNNSQQVSKEYDKMSNIEISTEKDSNIRFSNIAGNEEAKENIMELVDFIKNPQKYERYGARMPKGII